MSENIHEMI